MSIAVCTAFVIKLHKPGFTEILIVAACSPKLSGCTLIREFMKTTDCHLPISATIYSISLQVNIILSPSILTTVCCLRDLLMPVLLLSQSSILESYSSLNNHSFPNTFLPYLFFFTFKILLLFLILCIYTPPLLSSNLY